jgi:hypothetical protein
MSTQLNLKEIERKAFRSTYQDGIWDMYYGLIVMVISIFVYRPADGYSPVNILLCVLLMGAAYGLFWAGKRFITLPRMGRVRFGEVRKRKARTLAIIMGVFVLVQVALVGITAYGWFRPDAIARVSGPITGRISGLLVVALIGSLIVGTSMIVSTYFTDFTRGYYISIVMALAVFLMIYLNQPVYPIILGALIILPGLVLFIRFLKMYPLHRQDESND